MPVKMSIIALFPKAEGWQDQNIFILSGCKKL